MRKDCLCLVLAAAWSTVKCQMMVPPMGASSMYGMPMMPSMMYGGRYGPFNSPLMTGQVGYGAMPGYPGQWGSSSFMGPRPGYQYPFMGSGPFSRIPALFSGSVEGSSESMNPSSFSGMPSPSELPSGNMMSGQNGMPSSPSGLPSGAMMSGQNGMPSSPSGMPSGAMTSGQNGQPGASFSSGPGSQSSGRPISPGLAAMGQASGAGNPGGVPQYSGSSYPNGSRNSGRGSSGMQSSSNNQP